MGVQSGSTTENPILAFYEERGRDGSARHLREILAWEDEELESVHNYIQWLFPLPEPSMAVPGSPTLDPATIVSFRSDPELRKKLHEALLRMLKFYGLEEVKEGRRIVIRPGAEFPSRAANWLHPGNHNHLRLSRILRSLMILGLEAEAVRLFDCLASIYEEHHNLITPISFSYWKAAVSRGANSALKSRQA